MCLRKNDVNVISSGWDNSNFPTEEAILVVAAASPIDG